MREEPFGPRRSDEGGPARLSGASTHWRTFTSVIGNPFFFWVYVCAGFLVAFALPALAVRDSGSSFMRYFVAAPLGAVTFMLVLYWQVRRGRHIREARESPPPA